MAYRNFTFSKIEEQFNVRFQFRKIFDDALMPTVEVSDYLKTTLQRVEDMPLNTEKLLSEALIFPLLQEIRVQNKRRIHLFSGEYLNVDKTKGLNGECDFILTKSSVPALDAPIIHITEAKHGEPSDLHSLAQTAAQMIGAGIVNARKHKNIEVYGACSSGYTWLFLKLEKQQIIIDTQRYTLQNLPLLLGVLQYIVDTATD